MSVLRFASAALLSVLALIALPSVAQGPGAPSTIYLSKGRVLDAAPPRQLSLDAHVQQILYQPGGLSMAYVGQDESEDGTLTQFVKAVATRKSDKRQTRTLLTRTVKVDGDALTQPPTLIGWTRDAHYLIVAYSENVSLPVDPAKPDGPTSEVAQTRYLSLDVAPEPAYPRPIPLPARPNAGTSEGFAWSPKHSRLLFRQQLFIDNKRPPDVLTLYTPARDEMTLVPVPEERETLGWLDETHLLLRKIALNEKPQWFRYALSEGTEEPIAEPKTWPETVDEAFDSNHVPDWTMTAKAPDLKLDVEQHPIVDNQRVAAQDSRAIWVRRIGGRPRLLTMPIGLTPGSDDPQAQWSPAGNQVAYIAHGDLFVSDLIERDARATEKLAAGEPLTCEEERQIVSSNLKQIGLGIVQYIQDYDEQWPPANNIKDRIMPYIKSEQVFRFGDVPFVYLPPPGPGLADVESPAELIIGEMDTPCARNVLYADGHVKSFPKQQKAPAPE